MKNLLIIYVFLLIAALSACNNRNGLKTPKTTIITGKINDLDVYADSMSVVITVKDLSGYETKKQSAIIHRDGTFEFAFEQYAPQDLSIKYDFRPEPIVKDFIAHPGDSIHIALEYRWRDFVKFSGDGDQTNNALFKYTSDYYTTRYDGAINMYRITDPVLYKAACDKMKLQLSKNRIEFINKEKPNDEVKTWTKNYVNLNYYLALFNFQHQYNHYKARKPGYSPLNDYVNYGDDLKDCYDAPVINGDAYRLLPELMPAPENQATVQTYNRQLIASVNKIANSNDDAILKQLLIGSLFRLALFKKDTEDFDKDRPLLDATVQAEFIKQPLLQYYPDVKKEVASFKAAAATALKNVNITGTPAGQMIDSIREQNKGKVVYLDFWATWCGPCKDEIPNSKKLMKMYKDKPVTFAFMCLDSKIDNWRSTLAFLNIPSGSQYFCDVQHSFSLRQGLKISAIPHYILLDKKGNIAYMTRGPIGLRPADPYTKRKIDELLN